MQNHTLLKFLFATKAVEIYGVQVRILMGKHFRHEVKARFNALLNAVILWNKISEKSMGESADSEEEINGHLVELIDRIIDLPPNEKEHFIDYLNKWEAPK